MPKYELKVMETRQETTDVKSIKLEKPSNFNFKPGQFITMKLEALNDERGSIRSLSIASSPTENFLMFTTRISQTGFKQRFNSLKPGDKATIMGPFGNFTLQDDFSKPAVFLAGGIGITPFRSMIKYACDEKLAVKIALIYSNRSFEQIAYYKEFEEWQKKNQNFIVENTLTDSQPANWAGGIGRITQDTIMETSEAGKSVYYVCGPPGFVAGMESVLKDIGVEESLIKVERFEGY